MRLQGVMIGQPIWLGAMYRHLGQYYWVNNRGLVEGKSTPPLTEEFCLKLKTNTTLFGEQKCGAKISGYACNFSCSSDGCDCESIQDYSCINVTQTQASSQPESEWTWMEAQQQCLKDGGHLAEFPNNDKHIEADNVWVGARNSFWIWVTDNVEPLEQGDWKFMTSTPSQSDYKTDDNSNKCLVMIDGKWSARACNNTSVTHFLCQGQIDITTNPDDGMNILTTTSPDMATKKLYIIIGALAGGIVVLVAVTVVLVICVRRAKSRRTARQSSGFEFINVGITEPPRYVEPEPIPVTGAASSSRQYVNSQPPATPSHQLKPDYGYAEPAAPSHQPKPDYGYAEPADVHISPTPRKARATPYATTSIEEVIQRERTGKDHRGQSASRAGKALNGLKKRLSWLMKSNQRTSINTLPSPPTTLKGPDVVPASATQSHIYANTGTS